MSRRGFCNNPVDLWLLLLRLAFSLFILDLFNYLNLNFPALIQVGIQTLAFGHQPGNVTTAPPYRAPRGKEGHKVWRSTVPLLSVCVGRRETQG